MDLGGSPSQNWNAWQNALLLRVSALCIGNEVSQMDEGCAAEETRLVLLRMLQRADPVVENSK
jgi:hypothetical protein